MFELLVDNINKVLSHEFDVSKVSNQFEPLLHQHYKVDSPEFDVLRTFRTCSNNW